MKFLRAIRSVLRILGAMGPAVATAADEVPAVRRKLESLETEIRSVRAEMWARYGARAREAAVIVDAILEDPNLSDDRRAALERVRRFLDVLLIR